MTGPATSPGPGLDLLAFGAHPDDVEIGCGGLLASAARRGYRTGIVDLSRSELSTAGTPELRAEEAARAAAILGLGVRENLGFPDGFIHPYAGYEGEREERARSPLARVVEVLRRLRPSLVVIPWTHERHPDHEATAALLTRAIFFAGVARFATRPDHPPFVPTQVLRYPMRYEADPSFVVDISAVVEQKAQAIAAYASQLGRSGPVDPGRPTPLIAAPLTLSAFEARDRYWGATIGVRAGEPYLTQAILGLHDPVAHFASNSFPGALFFGRPR